MSHQRRGNPQGRAEAAAWTPVALARGGVVSDLVVVGVVSFLAGAYVALVLARGGVVSCPC